MTLTLHALYVYITVIGGSVKKFHLTLNKLIQKVYQRNLVLFFMLINIVKVSFILTIRNGSFSRWRPRWLPRAISVDIKALFNLERCSWCQIVGVVQRIVRGRLRFGCQRVRGGILGVKAGVV